MSQYKTLGSALTPSRVSVYSPSCSEARKPVSASRYGAAGYPTRHHALYPGTTATDTTQLLPAVVPTPDLAFPRHSNKKEVSYSGYMEKHTGLSNKWEKRWFVLEGGFLKYYYEKEGHGVNAQPKAVIPMSSYTVHDGDDELQRRNCIVLKPIFPGDHEYRLALESAFQKRTWTGKLSAGSHKGRVKCLLVGPAAVGKTALAGSYFEGNSAEVELKASLASMGSHVGYVPAPESHRRDLVMAVPHGEAVVALECWENPGRGDWDHVRSNTFAGADVVVAVFSTADRSSLADLERMMQVEVRKYAEGAPIVLVGNKTDLRDARLEMPVVGHAQMGSRGHLSPRQRQEFSCVTALEGEEAAARMGAVAYTESSAFDAESIQFLFESASQYGLVHRNPSLAGLSDDRQANSALSRKYEMVADYRGEHLQEYEKEPRRSNDRYVPGLSEPLPIEAQAVDVMPPPIVHRSTATATSGVNGTW